MNVGAAEIGEMFYLKSANLRGHLRLLVFDSDEDACCWCGILKGDHDPQTLKSINWLGPQRHFMVLNYFSVSNRRIKRRSVIDPARSVGLIKLLLDGEIYYLQNYRDTNMEKMT